MGLQVWLSLNGSLKNQGLAGDFVLPGTGTYEDGIIGKKALSIDGTHYEYTVPELVGVTKYSVSMWIKIDSSQPYTDYTDIYRLYVSYSSGNAISRTEFYNQSNIGVRGYIGKDTSVGSNTNNYWLISTNPFTDAQDKWCHIAFTKDDDYARYYINGSLDKEVECSNFENTPGELTGLIMLGAGTANCPVLINDFRIYDNVLSPREIKELSKGLILHMPLAPPGGENLILNSRNITTDNYALTRATADGKKITLTPTTSGSYLKYKATNVPYGEYKNKTYTVSFYARRISGNSEYTEKGVICYFGVNPTNRINNTLSMSYDKYRNLLTINTITNEWGFYSFTATIPDDLTSGPDSAIVDTSMITFQLAVSGSGLPVEVIPIKFEIGDHPTPWTPNPADPEYTAMGFNDGIEYDVSGNGYNGTKYGDIIWSGDTPRYNGCYQFNGTNSRISVFKPTFIKDEVTFSWWVCADNWSTVAGSPVNCVQGGGWGLQRTSNTNIDFLMGTGTSAVAWITYHVNTSTLSAGWHHFAGTYDGFTFKSYIDGIEVNTNTNYTTKTPIYYNGNANHGHFFIGGESGTSTSNPDNYFNGKVSDVRVYATALSAEDILALYNTPESLTNTGALLTQGEFTEV